LWLNLPSANKMDLPDYCDVTSDAFPVLQAAEGHVIKVLIGRYEGLQAPVIRPITEPLLLDVQCAATGQIEIPIPSGHTACLYVYEGAVSVRDTRIAERQLAILDQDPNANTVTLIPNQPSRILLIAGKPLHEPVVQYGPFVMNTQDEIQQAVRDYQEGRFG
jgi:redox-sensitive bicupin YhaK (pirin superfamily)